MARKSRRSTTTQAQRDAAAARRGELMKRLDAFRAEHQGNETAEGRVILAKILSWTEHYSERNAELIVMQDENATKVRTFRGWQDEGRQVRKGEKAIYILAPAGQSEGSEPVKATDEAPAQPGEAPRQFFRQMAVFDIRQTDEIKAEADDKAAELVSA